MPISALNSYNIYIEELFSSTATSQAQRQTLAQTALAKGADRSLNGDNKGAARAFMSAISFDPSPENAVKAYDLLATIYLQDDKVDDALKAYQSALRFDPSNDAVHTKIGNIYFSKGQYDDAEKEYKKAAAVGTRSSAELYALGQTYLVQNRYQEAEAEFKQVISMDPGNHGGYYALGQTYNKEGRFEEAVKEFEKVVKLKPDFYDVAVDLGSAYADLNEMDKAQEQLTILQKNAENLAPLLSAYMEIKANPRVTSAIDSSGFVTSLGPNTKLDDLDGSLSAPAAIKTFSMTFMFDKDMDTLSIQNPYNWTIMRSQSVSPAGPYNWGLSIPDTEAQISPIPVNVIYRPNIRSATVSFLIKQNDAATGTIDPSHIVFKFNGKDVYGNAMDTSADEYSGISKIV